jgi:uncharacterized protein with FMN-binding domain
MSKNSKPHQSKSSAKPSGRQAIDPLLVRLEQLDSRRPGSPLPPPKSSQSAAPAATASSSNKAGAAPMKVVSSTKVLTSTPSARIPIQGANATQQAKLQAAAERAAAARAGAKPVGRRAKPARASKMAALAMSAVTTVGLAAMFANQNSTTDSVILTGGTVAAGAGAAVPAAAPTTAPGAAVPAAPPTTVAAAPAATSIADGTYVGGASQNRWGVVQVQAVYAGGQLTDVQILSYPNDRNTSVRINQYALPILIGDSISAQSANINGVSGATYTSRSYVKSLQSAIDAAKAASGVAG